MTLKVRLANFTTLSRARTLPDATDVGADLYHVVAELYGALPGAVGVSGCWVSRRRGCRPPAPNSSHCSAASVGATSSGRWIGSNADSGKVLRHKPHCWIASASAYSRPSRNRNVCRSSFHLARVLPIIDSGRPDGRRNRCHSTTDEQRIIDEIERAPRRGRPDSSNRSGGPTCTRIWRAGIHCGLGRVPRWASSCSCLRSSSSDRVALVGFVMTVVSALILYPLPRASSAATR